MQHLSDSVKERIKAFEDKELKTLMELLQKLNGYVVECNEAISATLGCNTNVSLLGSETQAKATLFYLIKYVAKHPTELVHSLAILHHVRKQMDKYPSKAEDPHSDERSAMYFVSKVANSLNGTVEVSAQMANLAILGAPAETSSCSFFLVFVSSALRYVYSHENYKDCSKEDELQNQKQSETIKYDEYQLGYETEENSDEDDELYGDVMENVFKDVAEQEFNPFETETNEQSEKDHPFGNSEIYKGPEGIVAVPQHIHYSFRGHHLLHYSLYEYAALIDIIPKKKKNSEKTDDQLENHYENKKGRKTNALYEFDTKHPLFQTHIQRIRSKIKVPAIVDRTPKPPPPKPLKVTEEWTNKANQFSQFFLTLFRPWTFNTNYGTLPGLLSWNALCQYVKHLEFSCEDKKDQLINQTRLKWMINAMQGLRVSDSDRRAVQQYRARVADRWNQPQKKENNDKFQIVEHEVDEGTKEKIDQEALNIINQMQLEASLDQLRELKISNEDAYFGATNLALQQILQPLKSKDTSVSKKK